MNTMHHSHAALAAKEQAGEPPSTQVAKGWIPTAEQREVILGIKEFLAAHGLTGKDLARHTYNAKRGTRRSHLNWDTKLAKFQYGAVDAQPMLDDFIAAEKVLRGIVEQQRTGGFTFEPSRAYGSFLDTVKAAEAEQGLVSARRLVIAVGPTGNGKTEACLQAMTALKSGKRIHGRRCWKMSLGAALRDVSRELGLPTMVPATKRRAALPMKEDDLELALIERLSNVRALLIFEELSEGNLSAGLLEFWVEVLNRTTATVVLAINPDGLSYLRTVGLSRQDVRDGKPMSDIAKQFLNRQVGAPVAFDQVEEAVVLGLLEQRLTGHPDESMATAAHMIALAGTLDGGYSLARKVVLKLAAQGAALKLTDAIVAAQIAAYRAKFAEPRRELAVAVQKGYRGRVAA